MPEADSELIVEQVPAALAGERLDRAVALVADVPRSVAADLVATGAVRLDDEVVTTRSRRLVVDEELAVLVPPPRDERPRPDPSVEVVVVHEDADLLVVDKPAGLVVHPGAGHPEGTLVNGLLARYPELADVGEPHRPGIVHRLDRGTSGLLVVARTADAHRDLVSQLAARTVTRTYEAAVWGHLDVARGVVDAPIGRSRRRRTAMAVAADGREARTAYEVLGAWRSPAAVSLLRCNLETGRTHQIRVHLAAIGHPVVGDERYGGDREPLRPGRPMLHAAHLALAHPRDGERRSWRSPRPADLVALLDALAEPVGEEPEG